MTDAQLPPKASDEQSDPDARLEGSGSLAFAMFRRIGDPAAWSDAGKCVFGAVAVGATTLWYGGLWLYSAWHPELEPYVDHAVLPWLLRLHAVSLIAWGIVFVCALARRRRQAAPVLVGATIVLLTYQLVYTTYFLGAHTNPFAGMTIIGCWAGALILFPRRSVVAAMIVWWLALLATTAAAQAGILPYAPLYRGAPVEGGRLYPYWLLGPGGATLLLMLFIQVVVYVIIERWHDRERRLAIVSRHLAQANDVISRYVASQLAEQIRAGNHSALERHERRRLTLFFSDIQDFAATADVVEPEDFSRQLNDYLSEMTSVAERYGATIDKFVGDAIMIFFGAPAATNDRDQALRAVRMAVEMQEHLVTLRQGWAAAGLERPFHVRMGINTGQASVGAFGSSSRLEYTAIGRQVNLAARLQAQCEPDRILLSHTTFTLVQDDIACTAMGEISVKGFHQPVRIYEVAAPAGEPLERGEAATNGDRL